jgi:hypothetical protein
LRICKDLQAVLLLRCEFSFEVGLAKYHAPDIGHRYWHRYLSNYWLVVTASLLLGMWVSEWVLWRRCGYNAKHPSSLQEIAYKVCPPALQWKSSQVVAARPREEPGARCSTNVHPLRRVLGPSFPSVRVVA